MKNDLPKGNTREIELKLTLPPHSSPDSIVQSLSACSFLAGREALSINLYDVYYDTPDQTLQKNRCTLRVRRKDANTRPTWIQTLKTGCSSESALCDRGEWETNLPNAKPTVAALKEAPWSNLDSDGAVFGALEVFFRTQFNRTTWLVRRRGGTLVEIALDIGKISVGSKSEPICEVELELLKGNRSVLFDLAKRISKTLAVLPSTVSKSERGYALKEGEPNAPTPARPIKLTSDLTVPDAARLVLRETLFQFTTNLNALQHSDDPEVVHQARVGWRRFRSACRLFKPGLAQQAQPSWKPLSPLLNCLGGLRDLDVARTETLPRLEGEYVGDSLLRRKQWTKLNRVLTRTTNAHRSAARNALKDPVVGATLISLVQWLEPDSNNYLGNSENAGSDSLRPWARARMRRMHKKLKKSLKQRPDSEAQHHARILAKRMRYDLEALGPLLSTRRARIWHQEATHLQERFGAKQDMLQAANIVSKLNLDRSLLAFLTGLC